MFYLWQLERKIIESVEVGVSWIILLYREIKTVFQVILFVQEELRKTHRPSLWTQYHLSSMESVVENGKLAKNPIS